MEKITIKNLTTCNVGIRVPELRFNRIIRKNESIKVPKDVFEEVLTYPGVQPMIDQKIIGIVEPEARVELGLEWEEDPAAKEDLANAAEIAEILSNGSDFAVKKLCRDLSHTRKEDIAQIAFTIPSLSISRIDLITECTGIDILKGIKATKDLNVD